MKVWSEMLQQEKLLDAKINPEDFEEPPDASEALKNAVEVLNVGFMWVLDPDNDSLVTPEELLAVQAKASEICAYRHLKAPDSWEVLRVLTLGGRGG